jgi:hypothetical protein
MRTEDRVNPLAAGVALAVMLAFLNVLCAIFFAITPGGVVNSFNSFMHGIDLNLVRSEKSMTFGSVLYGVLGLAVIGFVSGVVFASVYNAMSAARWSARLRRNSAP